MANRPLRTSLPALLALGLLGLFGGAARPAAAQDPAPAPQWSWQVGPSHVELGHDLSLELPAGQQFLEPKQGAKALEKMGTFHNENLLGIVVGADESSWMVVIRYEAEGYVKDDEKIDAGELLTAFREGAAEGNKERVARGFEALTIGEWTEPPRYDRAKHHLVWGLEVKAKSGTSINYNTRVLGRRGFASLNLVDDPATISANKPEVERLLAATSFSQGARYEDFNASSDKVAEYGLAGLILGGAGLGAAKLAKVGVIAGLWKGIVALVIAGKKVVVVALVAVGAWLKSFLGGGGKAQAKAG